MSDSLISISFPKTLCAALLCASLIGVVSTAQAYTGEELAKYATVGLTEARTTALKAHPGQITDEELEKESGGSGLRYSFDIRNGNTTYEVGVDAKTGKVLENAAEGKNPD